jgi:hypothetical protein
MPPAVLPPAVNANLPEPVVALFQGLGFTDPAGVAGAAEIAFCDLEPGVTQADLMMRHARRRLADWFAVVLDRAELDDDAMLAAGRAAYLLADAARRWPEHFLSDDPLPRAMRQALRRVAPMPVPQPTPAVMVDQPLDPLSAGHALRALFGWRGVGTALRRPA